MTRLMKIGTLAVTAGLVGSCGGGGGTSPGPATTIDMASVTTGVTEISSVIPVCHSGSSLRSSTRGDPALGKTPWLARLLELRRDKSLRSSGLWEGLGSTKPADQFGDCGGRITYPVYSHSNGVTTATYQFDNYCTTDSQTGEKSLYNGSIPFVNTGTPSNNGPITNRVTADSPDGVTFVTKNSSGQQLSSQKVAFTSFLYSVGVPGGSPTASNPNRLSLGSATTSDLVTGKTYRQTNLSVTSFTTTSGGDQTSFSGRGYRSNGEYFDMSTTSALTTSSSGSYTGGEITFTGANNTTAVMTVVPGSTLQATMKVNGTPVTGVPACK